MSSSGHARSLFTQPALARKLGGPDPASDEAIDVHARAVADLVVHGLVARDAGG